MEDISEEIARIYGFDNIEATLPSGSVLQGAQGENQIFTDKIRQALSSLGLCETVSFSFTHPSMFDKLNIPADSELRRAVPIMNPLTDEYPLVRTTLLSSIFEKRYSQFVTEKRRHSVIAVAPVFMPKELPVTEQPLQTLKLAGLCLADAMLSAESENEQVDFYDAKGVVEELLAQLAIGKYTVDAGEHYDASGENGVLQKGP